MSMIPRTNDHVLLQAMQKLTGLNSLGFNPKTYFEHLDMLPECALELPFLFKKFIVVYEKLPIIHDIMFPKPSCSLLDILADAPEAPFLITDLGSQGVDSLYVVTQTDANSVTPEDWMEHMTLEKLVMNNHPKYGKLFAAALTSFYNVR